MSDVLSLFGPSLVELTSGLSCSKLTKSLGNVSLKL